MVYSREPQNAFTNQTPKELASLYTFGSFRMKINEPSADVDTCARCAAVTRRMCVGPEYVSREEFFEIAGARLKNNPGVSDLSVIPDAFPLLSFRDGIGLCPSLR